MPRLREKIERRLGERLFLKGDRCVGPKCAVVRRNYPSGTQGAGKRGRRRKESSEYGTLAREKQKIRFFYGIDNSDVKRYSNKALKKRGIFAIHFLSLLERRLDNVVFRLGFGESRHHARQLISHGHIRVGAKAVRVASYSVRMSDAVSMKNAGIKPSPLIFRMDQRLKKHEPPKWLELDKNKRQGNVARMPEEGDFELMFDAAKIKEFYSR